MNRTVLATVFAALALPAASLAQMGGMAMPAGPLRPPASTGPASEEGAVIRRSLPI